MERRDLAIAGALLEPKRRCKEGLRLRNVPPFSKSYGER
jgi:hypothetical protein